MRVPVHLSSHELEPLQEEVLAAQGLPRGVRPSGPVRQLLESALLEFRQLARPAAVYQEVSRTEFGTIYPGEGKNSSETPLEGIFPRAHSLALFASTLGEGLCRRIRELFDAGDPALGSMLDAVASLAADRSSTLLGKHYLEEGKGETAQTLGVLPYSPGYCGWHVSGQRALFATLEPHDIGIHLNDSCLMTPLKSVSGVLVLAEPAAHDFVNDFPFCGGCATHDCRERIGSLALAAPAEAREKHKEDRL